MKAHVFGKMAGIIAFDGIVRRALARERVFRDRENPMEMLNDEEIYERYRFDRGGIIFITNLIEDDIESPTERNHAIPPILQVFVALRFYACGSFQQVIADTIRIHQSTACRIIHRVTNALIRRINQFVRFPTGNEVNAVKAGFYDVAHFPNVLGLVDGSHVRIMAPHRNEPDYVNRKKYHSINAQIICNDENMITNVVANWPGSTHDSRILRESEIGRQFARQEHRGVLIGDSGYSSKNWLMIPYLNPANDPQRRYNRALKRTRCIVECTIGIWKRRFHCLHDELRLHPIKCCRIIAATAILHNIAKQRNLPDFEDEIDNEDQPDPVQPEDDHDDNLTRDRLVQQYFQ